MKNEKNIKNHCGFTGSLWSSDYNSHNAWCMKNNRNETAAATGQRNQLLNQCESEKPAILQIQPIKIHAAISYKVSSLFTPPIVPGISVFIIEN